MRIQEIAVVVILPTSSFQLTGFPSCQPLLEHVGLSACNHPSERTEFLNDLGEAVASTVSAMYVATPRIIQERAAATGSSNGQ